VAPKDTYTPGYSEVALRYMKRRHAARDAAFFLPHLKPGMKLLDCGCGPGTITVGFARAVGHGLVMAVDVEPGQVVTTEQTAREQGLTNVQVRQANVYDLPFPDRSFDAIFSHALFEHLADPLAALRQFRRLLKPGGPVGIASPDWDGVVYAPKSPEVDEAIKAYTTFQAHNGGNPFVGRELGRLLSDAGFVEIVLGATYDCYERMDLICDLLAERIEGEAEKTGLLDIATVSRLTAALKQLATHPVSLFAQCFVTAIGRAPS
jgi:ubiquinone/menaquinone biosynthesis C-methylase UbiE